MITIRSRSVTRVLLATGASLLAAALAIAPASAKTDFGVRGGAYSDTDGPFLGAEALFDVGNTHHWFGNPNLEHVFDQTDRDLTSVSFDFHYDFPSGQPYTIWAGAGPTMIFRDRNNPMGDSRTDAGVNLLLGVGSKRGDVRPYGQMKVVLSDDSEAVVGVGVRF